MKLEQYGYVSHDEDTGVYRIKLQGLEAQSLFNTQSVFSSYDVSCIVKYAGMDYRALKEMMNQEYEPDYAREQTEYLISRLDKNVDRGYLFKDGNVYRL
jgi:hypothetical protein